MVVLIHIMSGAGNIFSVIDNRVYKFDKETLQNITSKICHVNPDKPTEGFIAINAGDDEYDFHADFFNPDGTYGAMCGNGGRCAVLFAYNASMIHNPDRCTFSMANTKYSARVLGNGIISVDFPSPLSINTDIEMKDEHRTLKGGYINVGSDHFITEINSEDFADFDIIPFARPIRYHKTFEPRGVNVNIFRLDTKNRKVSMRTYERGVEAETGACGTGAISTALYIALTKQWDSPITLIPTSGEELTVGFTITEANTIQNLRLEGNARFLDSFEIDMKL